jgi:hypothetical protein
MAQGFITDLFDRWAGKPILVVGGGPSVTTDLLIADINPACVISANGHGAKQDHYPVDIFTHMDIRHVFEKTPVEPELRKLGGIIVSKYSSADYRLGDFNFICNTGIAAVIIAAALGGDPVLVTGLDFFHGGRKYFHMGDKVDRYPIGSIHRTIRRQMRQYLSELNGANIRPLSGPLLAHFPKFDAAEVLPPRKDTPYRTKMLKIAPKRVNVGRAFALHNYDVVPAGKELVLTPREADKPLRSGFAL